MSARGNEIGEQFARSLANKDRAALAGLLADDINFQAMTPRKVWDATTPAEIVDDVIFGHWFEPSDHIEALVSVETTDVGDRSRVGYRMRVRNDEGLHVVEQQAYFDAADGKIDYLRIMCSGYRPLSE